MAEHGVAQALGNAERRGERTVIQRMLANGFGVSHIARATGYTEQQIAAILKEKCG
jgi:hypothetical protein